MELHVIRVSFFFFFFNQNFANLIFKIKKVALLFKQKITEITSLHKRNKIKLNAIYLISCEFNQIHIMLNLGSGARGEKDEPEKGNLPILDVVL